MKHGVINIKAVEFDVEGHKVKYDCLNKIVHIGNEAFKITELAELLGDLKELGVDV